MNHEGYQDQTAERAIAYTAKVSRAAQLDRPPQEVSDLVHVIRDVARCCGYEITNRIYLKDRKTGKEWR